MDNFYSCIYPKEGEDDIQNYGRNPYLFTWSDFHYKTTFFVWGGKSNLDDFTLFSWIMFSIVYSHDYICCVSLN